MALQKRVPSTRYYRWDGKACRVHEDERCDLTADIYRAGNAYVPISPTDVIDGAVQIGQAEYERLTKWYDQQASQDGLRA